MTLNAASTYLVVGAGGFLGQAITRALLDAGCTVHIFDIACDVTEILRGEDNTRASSDRIKVYEGSVFDHELLVEAMAGADVVCMVASFSVPGSLPAYMTNELETTLRALNVVLSTMVQRGIRRIIFPSSGGTLYGDTGGIPAKEDDSLRPVLSYGMGKLLGEQLIQFYNRVHNINYLIMRISNLYGTAHLRRISQGVIDVFLQKVIRNDPLEVWGSLDTVRDYLFMDDFIAAFLKLAALPDETLIVNVGSGLGATLNDILACIAEITGAKPNYTIIPAKYSEVQYSVLDISYLQRLVNWQPQYSLQDGICATWLRKKHVLA